MWRAKVWHWSAFLSEPGRYSGREHINLIRYCWGGFPAALWQRYEREEFLRRVRRMLGAPGFPASVSLAAVIVIAIFSFGFQQSRSLLLSAPVPEPDKFVSITYSGGWWSPLRDGVPPRWLPVWENETKYLEGVAQYALQSRAFRSDGLADRVGVSRVSPNFFEVARAVPARGRFFSERDACTGCVVISYAFWSDRLKKRDVIGKQAQLGEETVTVIGIAPPRFWVPENGVAVWQSAQRPVSDSRWAIPTLARIRGNVSPEEAERALRSDIEQVHGWPGGGLEITPFETQARLSLVIYLILTLTALLVITVGGTIRYRPTNLTARRLVRWSLFLPAKAALLLLACSLFLIELTPWLTRAVGGTFESSVWPIVFWSCLALSVGVVMWALRDQRYRCPVCLARLELPVLVGDPSRLLFDRGATEFVCPHGHGLLHISDMQCSWIDPEAWTGFDESWGELFERES